jgi:hypothetical protein
MGLSKRAMVVATFVVVVDYDLGKIVRVRGTAITIDDDQYRAMMGMVKPVIERDKKDLEKLEEYA